MKYRLLAGIGTTLLLSLALVPAPTFAASSCESLAALKLPDTTITGAAAVPAGPFTPPAAPEAPNAPRPIQLPAFCRAQLTVSPEVKIEIWMPATGWNGNFEGVGNGGFAGTITYAAMSVAMQAGYATASTNTGHEGNNMNFALNHPERLEDFGYRGIHEMTLKAKQVIEAFYGAAPRLSFFNGCSEGGRQALTEAQRYPEDYNGILAGSPAVNRTNFMVAHLQVGLWTLKDEQSYIPPAKLQAIQNASVAACDAQDGLKDGLVSDPRSCKFDPSTLLCKEGDAPNCLTAKQVETLKMLYSPVKDADGKVLYPRHLPGAETNMRNFTTGAEMYKGTQYTYGVSYFSNVVFNDPNWDFHTWDYAHDMKLVNNEKLRSWLDSYNTDLRPFRDHGDKVIVFQGWADDDVSPLNTINYFKAVVSTVTGMAKGATADTPENAEFFHAADQTGNFMRLFIAPGMGHCGGGIGPNTFDGMGALATWVEKKQAPDQLMASHMTNGKVDRTRPLCPFPQTAQYSGQGSIDEAANFVCKLPAAK